MLENECLKSGCQAACCHDIFFLIPMRKKEILAAFPQAKPLVYFKFVADRLPDGIYYYLDRVRIVGKCPHLSENNCMLIKKEIRPISCIKHDIASDGCIFARRRGGQN